jgi:hypothetical protein
MGKQATTIYHRGRHGEGMHEYTVRFHFRESPSSWLGRHSFFSQFLHNLGNVHARICSFASTSHRNMRQRHQEQRPATETRHEAAHQRTSTAAHNQGDAAKEIQQSARGTMVSVKMLNGLSGAQQRAHSQESRSQ